MDARLDFKKKYPVQRNFSLSREMNAALAEAAKKLGVPQAVLVRQAIQMRLDMFADRILKVEWAREI